ncbi:transglycosylase SLT domain-containing protein [Shewanella sp. SR44-3]|uniref:transglycosylase SLT domain-containing protein n=1 Tax=Shewanella sp. SR44-3 TaxID=2760936 RepID=UPI0015FDDE62|nr:transglycosylase SLT domain-containing protein [Shewanella sp. SR44-3]MBB1270075.1 transglycosylase SLT domain-containing protein [Shewanella sp. SR44-3]
MRVSLYLFASSLLLLSGCQTIAIKEDISQESGIQGTHNTTSRIRESTQRISADNADVWQRIRRSMAMPVPNHPLVNRYRDWFIQNPQHLELISERARPFLYLIVEELEKRDLPIELAFLPIVESSFNPLAYSRAQASGLWQFTSPMASHFGLDMNWWYDGRKDVPAATIAALDMLEYLYKKTDNWLYALAAYNAGEGRVRNAIQLNQARGLNTDFWSLDLPTETEQYVPQLLALAEVIKHADKYGINLNAIPNKPLVEIIDVGSQIDLSVAAELAQIPIERLQKLNPGFNRWATSPHGPHQLVVPVSKADDFKQALAETDISDRVKWFKYQIKAGDNINAIAKRHHTSALTIKSMNDITGDRIVAGQFLYMPDVAIKAKIREVNNIQVLAPAVSNKRLKQQSAIVLAPKDARVEPINNQWVTKSVNGRYRIEHKVRYADTLWSIAKIYKVSVAQITRWNKMSDSHKISEGKTLKIWTLVTQDGRSAALSNI